MCEVCIEKMEAVIAPDLWGDICSAVDSFFQGLYDGLTEGLVF